MQARQRPESRAEPRGKWIGPPVGAENPFVDGAPPAVGVPCRSVARMFRAEQFLDLGQPCALGARERVESRSASTPTASAAAAPSATSSQRGNDSGVSAKKYAAGGVYMTVA